MKVYNVHFIFDEKEKENITVKAVEGETILEIAESNNIDLNHNCGGVCACTTCHVYIENGMDNLSEMSEKEENYVDRAIDPRVESRLGCQCEIYGDINVRIPNQKLIIGH